MNKKTIIVGLCIFLVINASVISQNVTGLLEDQMMPGMLTTDAPYYTYVQNDTESTTTRLAYSPPEITGAIGQWIEQIDEDMVLYYIQNLVDFGPRVTGSTACDSAGTYIYEEFENLGLDVRYHYWTSGSYSGKNVEATLEGLDPTSDKIFIVLGHYDSVSGSPGADDNAAGTTAALAAAEVLSQYRFQHTIRFLAVDGEEQGLHGSAKYAEEAANNDDNIIAALNADMIGYAPDEGDGDFVKIYSNTASNWIYEYTNNISTVYASILNNLQPIDAGYIPYSDHASFIEQGYHAALYHEYVFNPYYHSPNDIIAHMNLTYDAMVTRLIVAALAELAEPIIHEHDILVSDLVIPSLVPYGITQTVQATITNVGNNTETDIIVDFLVNDTVLNSTTIASLDTIDSTIVNFSWDPDYGTYLVAIASQPVPGEEDLSNNQVNKTVEVIPAPFIQVTPDSLAFMAPTNAVDSESIQIENLASAEDILSFSISFSGYQGGDWLSADIMNGDILVGDSEMVTISVDTTGLDEGNYQGYVIVSSNDIITPVVMVPVDLTVVYGHDMRVVSINSPIGTVPFGDYVVNATVQNLGFYPQTNVLVNLSIFEGSLDYFEDFEEDNGGFEISGGVWQYGSPSSGPSSAFSGDFCWGTNLEGNYPNNANARLDSPEIMIPQGNSASLSFYHWYHIEDGSGHYDGGNVKVSTDGGISWDVLGSYLDPYPVQQASSYNSGIPGEPCFTGSSSGWELVSFDVSDYAGETVRFRWHFGSDSYVTYPGWYLDDVSVIGQYGFRDGNELVFSSEEWVSLDAYERVDVLFSPVWAATGGNYTIQVITMLDGDQNPANDLKTAVVVVNEPVGPSLAFAPEFFDFGLMLVNTTDSTSLTIWNSGDGTLSYVLSETCDWLSLSSYDGEVSTGVDTIMVDVDTTGLASGLYMCNISINSDGGDGVFVVSMFVVDDTTEFLDVDQSKFERGFRLYPEWNAAQEFIPSYQTLTRIELFMTKLLNPTGDIIVEIREGSAVGPLVDSTVLFPDDVPSYPEYGWVSIDLGTVSVTIGEPYFIVLKDATGADTRNNVQWTFSHTYGTGGPYDGGWFWFQRLPNPSWTPRRNWDYTFRTYGY